ncbi:MAG: hypothetical protein R3B40_13660 [Polyangiales bacterium]|nr:hypothetical protein [Myxococcales bacterium]MCB9659847.1 hypothetical protein [Sandaracinaceae bacterium]
MDPGHALAPALCALAVVATMLLTGVRAANAQADREPAGVLAAPVLLQHDCLANGCEGAGVGGAIQLDLLHVLRAAPWLSLGGTVGVGVVGGEADSTRVFVPFGASLIAGLFPDAGRRVGFEARLRGGAWFGAGAWGTLARAELGGGGFLGGGLHAAIGLGDAASRARLRVTIGLDVTRLFGSRAVTLYAPGIALAWRPAPSSPGTSP